MDFGVKYWPPFFPLREGELAEEILVNVAQDVLGFVSFVLEGDGDDEIDKADQARRRELELGVAFIEDVLELGFSFSTASRASSMSLPMEVSL